MNFAVLASGGKQYKVFEGLVFDVEKLDIEVGTEIVLENVLLAQFDGKLLTNDHAKAVRVHAKIEDQYRDRKVTIIKFKRRKNYFRKQGHRQSYTTLKVQKIDFAQA